MTTPSERTLAVLETREFLEQLAKPHFKMPVEEIQAQARALLRHYPSTFDIRMAAELEEKTLLGIQVFSKESPSDRFDMQIEP